MTYRSAATGSHWRMAALAVATLIPACAQIDGGKSAAPPPTVEQLRTEAAEHQAANRSFAAGLETRLNAASTQGVAPLQGKLAQAIGNNLGQTGARLGEVACGGDLCRVEIDGVTAANSKAVLALLATSQQCAMPLIDFPEATTDNQIRAYLDCSGPEQ